MLSRVLYTEDLQQICTQQLTTLSVSPINSPLGEGAWLSVEIEPINESNCNYTREDGVFLLGIGEMFPDLSIALEMVEWESSDEQLTYEEVQPLGGDAILDGDDNIMAFGAAYPQASQTDPQVDIALGSWVIRPIYSFKW